MAKATKTIKPKLYLIIIIPIFLKGAAIRVETKILLTFIFYASNMVVCVTDLVAVSIASISKIVKQVKIATK